MKLHWKLIKKSRRPTSKNGGPRLLTIADGSVARARLIPRRFPRDFRVVTATRALQLAWSRTTVCCARVALLCCSRAPFQQACSPTGLLTRSWGIICGANQLHISCHRNCRPVRAARAPCWAAARVLIFAALLSRRTASRSRAQLVESCG